MMIAKDRRVIFIGMFFSGAVLIGVFIQKSSCRTILNRSFENLLVHKHFTRSKASIDHSS